jgi:hypothetical protein
MIYGAIVLIVAIGSPEAAEVEQKPNGIIPAGVWRYAERWAARYDADGDGRLTRRECGHLEGDANAADTNQDGLLSVEELARHIADFGQHRKIRLMPAAIGGVVPLPSLLHRDVEGAKPLPTKGEANGSRAPDEEPAETADRAKSDSPKQASDRKYVVSPSRLPPGLPDWFLKHDSDGDGQLTLSEYAESGSTSADKEFARYDRNQDGLITPREVLGGAGETRRAKRPPTPVSEPKPKTAESTEGAKNESTEGGKNGSTEGAKNSPKKGDKNSPKEGAKKED